MWLLNDVADRQQKRLETGKASSGLSTGIAILDETLNGLNTGLYILAGPPGVGKTTLVLHIAGAAVGVQSISACPDSRHRIGAGA